MDSICNLWMPPGDHVRSVKPSDDHATHRFSGRCCRFCPFAQRTLLALNAKGVAYVHHELSDTDLYSKPAWFLDLNPAGLVPTLAWLTPGGERRVLGESLIINE
jgi:hypothetical protein